MAQALARALSLIVWPTQQLLPSQSWEHPPAAQVCTFAIMICLENLFYCTCSVSEFEGVGGFKTLGLSTC